MVGGAVAVAPERQDDGRLNDRRLKFEYLILFQIVFLTVYLCINLLL